MAATATANASNGMGNPNNRSNLAQAFVELGTDLFSIAKPRSAMGATANAQSIGGRAGGLSEADRTMISVVAGLKGGHAKAMDEQIQQAAELGARAAKEAGHKGRLTEEQAQAISEQVMKGLEGKHLSAQVKEKTRFGKSKAAFIGTLGAATALAAGTVALAAKPLAWAGDKVLGTKMSESFTVRGALTKGFLAVAVTFAAAGAYDMHKRNSRNNAREAALVHAIQHGAQKHAEGRFTTRAEAAAAAPKQEPALAPEAPKQDVAAAKTVPNFGANNALNNPANVTYSFGPVKTAADATKKEPAAQPMKQAPGSVIPSVTSIIPTVKTVAAAAVPAVAAAVTAEKVAAAIKPDFGNKTSYGSITYGGDVKLGTGGAIPGKTPEIPGAKVETTRS